MITQATLWSNIVDVTYPSPGVSAPMILHVEFNKNLYDDKTHGALNRYQEFVQA